MQRGQATITTRLLPSGTAPLRATYSGDEINAPSTSSALSQSVKALPASSFALEGSFETGPAPYSVAVGDFNADGFPDLAVANRDSDNVAVLLGDGRGGFVEPPPGSPFFVGGPPSSSRWVISTVMASRTW